jgi:pilus assembly protein Flp/PilA
MWMRKTSKVDLTNVKNYMEDEEGATAVEYGMLVALIAAMIVTVVGLLGGQIQAAFQSIVDAL